MEKGWTTMIAGAGNRIVGSLSTQKKRGRRTAVAAVASRHLFESCFHDAQLLEPRAGLVAEAVPNDGDIRPVGVEVE